MLKRMTVLVCGAGVMLVTAGPVSAQAVDTAKEKTQAAASKTGQVLSDAEITAAVKSKFALDKTVSALNINVDTSDGIVTLTGPVKTTAERNAAVRIARQTKGVKSVTNNLKVETAGTTAGTTGATESGTKKSDDEKSKIVIKDDTTPKVKAAGRKTEDATITAAVKTKLATVKGVIVNDINVDTDNGVVTLRGSVPEASQKARAEEVARTVPGVKRVVDELTVQK